MTEPPKRRGPVLLEMAEAAAADATAPDPVREKGVMGCNDGHAEIILRYDFNALGAASVRNRVWNAPDTANGH